MGSFSLLVIDYVALYSVFVLSYRILSGYSVLSRYWLVVVVPSIVVLAANACRNRRISQNLWIRFGATALVMGNFVISVGLILHLGLAAG